MPINPTREERQRQALARRAVVDKTVALRFWGWSWGMFVIGIILGVFLS